MGYSFSNYELSPIILGSMQQYVFYDFHSYIRLSLNVESLLNFSVIIMKHYTYVLVIIDILLLTLLFVKVT